MEPTQLGSAAFAMFDQGNLVLCDEANTDSDTINVILYSPEEIVKLKAFLEEHR